MIDKDHILSEIRRTAQENDGAPLGRGRFAQETGIREQDWIGKHWARWGDAVREAGFQPNQLNARIDDEMVLDQLMLFTRRLGRFPTEPELRMRAREGDGFPSGNVFARFGLKRERIARLASYCRERPGCDDVLRLLLPLLEADVAASTEPRRSTASVEWGPYTS